MNTYPVQPGGSTERGHPRGDGHAVLSRAQFCGLGFFGAVAVSATLSGGTLKFVLDTVLAIVNLWQVL